MLRLVRNLIVLGSVWFLLFCCIGGLLSYVAVKGPRQGDDMGLGIICISFPAAGVLAYPALKAIEYMETDRPKKKKRGE
jgi:hypothetical protein